MDLGYFFVYVIIVLPLGAAETCEKSTPDVASCQ